MEKIEIEEIEVKTKKKNVLVAKKDFTFKFNGKVYEIKRGELINIDSMFLPNLKTENVL